MRDPRTVHVPWKAITRAEFRPRLLRRVFGTRLALSLTDGSVRKLVVFPSALAVGEPWDSVAERLGDRLPRRGLAAREWPSQPAA